MKKNKAEQHFWKKYFNLPAAEIGSINPQARTLNFRESSIGDEELNWLTARFRRIEQLDLDYAEVTDMGISYLTRLEHLGELRLKCCSYITAACLGDLNKITSLETLHLGYTAIQARDLEALRDLQQLRLLLVSSDDTLEAIGVQAARLRQLLPQCIFSINYKPYDPEPPGYGIS